MSKKNYIVLTEKEWHKDLFIHLKNRFNDNSWYLIDNKKDFNFDNLNKINPDKIFIPHWSYIISSEIYNNFECIVFHMTDLPFGRGGSPLQNLIVRGFKSTKITAIKVEKGIDTGSFYLKKDLNLDGSAREIFERSSFVIEEMIIEIIEKNIVPTAQEGQIVEFKRRKPDESDITEIPDLEKVYDFIRMLDCEGYPRAFIETKHLKIEFTEANFISNQEIITASVRISKK